MTFEEAMNAGREGSEITPAMWRNIKASITDGRREACAVELLACFAKLMIEGDPITRMEAHEYHARVLRWVWERKCERDWKGSPLMEVQ